MVVVSYDVSTIEPAGQSRLRRVSKLCKDYGQRVQYSVFECSVDPAQWAFFRAKLIKEINHDQDSLRFYFLGANWRNRVEHVGTKKPIDYEEPLVI